MDLPKVKEGKQFFNIKSVVGDYIAGTETVESIQSQPSPRKVA